MLHAVRSDKVSGLTLLGLALLSAGFMLCWQFGQFPLLIQAFALYLTYCVEGISPGKVSGERVLRRCNSGECWVVSSGKGSGMKTG